MSHSSRVVAIEHLTLDGVYQAPGRPDEDRSGGFSHGGWSKKRDDPTMQQAIAGCMEGGWSLLVGRKTFEVLRESWPILQPDNSMTKALSSVQKFVASHTDDPLPDWENSSLLAGEAADTVRRLKAEQTKTLVVFGSGELLRSLLPAGLVDEWLLFIHPIVLGEGLRLFETGTSPSTLRLIQVEGTDAGVMIARYASATAD